MILSRRGFLRGFVATTALAAVLKPTDLWAAFTTFNIHPNLTAWANSTFTAGQRCSTGGNAYQAINGGTSTAAPTGTTSSVNNGGVCNFKWLSAIDFTSIQAWWTATPATWITNYIVLNWNNGEIVVTAGTGVLAATGKTVGSFTWFISAAIGESLRDQPGAAATYNPANGVAFRGDSAASFYTWYTTSSGGTIDGLQLKMDATSWAIVSPDTGCTNLTVSRCFMVAIPQGPDSAYHCYFSTPSCNMIDCTLVDLRAANGAGECVKWDTGGTGSFIGCTVISTNSVSVLNRGTGIKAIGVANSVTVRNSSFWNYTSPMIDDNNICFVVDHCVTSAASWDNISLGINDAGNNLVSKTTANQFQNATAAADMRPKFGADTIGHGVVDLTDIPDGLDFYRVARGTLWDIGPIQYPAGGKRQSLMMMGVG
jgi:hypothetical protein